VKYWGYFLIVIAATVAVLTVQGCDMGDVVRARTPVGIQQSDGLPASMTLNESRHEFERWLDDTRRNGAAWRGNIEQADAVRDVLAQVLMQGLDDIGPTVAGVPVLAAGFPLLTGLAGLFVRRPGDKKATDAERERDAAWDEAFEAGKRAALDGVAARVGA
jgi:hypothetical protein